MIKQHQLLITHLNTHTRAAHGHHSQIFRAGHKQASSCFAGSCKDLSTSSSSAIRHNWFAGQGKSLHALAQASQHQYCSQSPLRTWSKILPVSSSPYTRAVYRPKQDLMWSKCSGAPRWFRNAMLNSITTSISSRQQEHSPEQTQFQTHQQCPVRTEISNAPRHQFFFENIYCICDLFFGIIQTRPCILLFFYKNNKTHWFLGDKRNRSYPQSSYQAGAFKSIQITVRRWDPGGKFSHILSRGGSLPSSFTC